MPRKSPAVIPPPDKSVALPKSGTTYLFPKTREERRSALTHAQIAEDLAAFERAGGRIEVLGNTYTFKSIGPNRRGASAADTAGAEVAIASETPDASV